VKTYLRAIMATSLLSMTSVLGMGAELPDLAQLKLAAEAGDPVAQFNYGRRIAAANYQEQFSWYMLSAQQGYAPGQNAVGEHIAGQFPYDPKKKIVAERESLRWISRAAYQGFPAAQQHLAEFYAKGIGVPKDPISAYMWAQVVISNPNSSVLERAIAGYFRDGIIANTSSTNIQEAQRRAAAFSYPESNELNPVETELMFSQLKLGAIFHLNNRASATVNNVRFYSGDTKDVKVDEHLLRLTCTAIEGNYARFKIAGIASETTLFLKR